MTEKDLILKNLSRKYGISMAQARDIEDSLGFVADVMVNKSDRTIPYFPSVRIASFGVFHCPERLRLRIKALNDGKK